MNIHGAWKIIQFSCLNYDVDATKQAKLKQYYCNFER